MYGNGSETGFTNTFIRKLIGDFFDALPSLAPQEFRKSLITDEVKYCPVYPVIRRAYVVIVFKSALFKQLPERLQVAADRFANGRDVIRRITRLSVVAP